ncbi:phosphopeptide-binding protein [Sinomonas cellulolyticus]|jgi:hypothetical protein|uniref:DUF3662 and FHA domain-containing protein n=1 Tax=Sinomonas cellulolyticus TaxID=2801916 RepID=A0ABS1K5M9_9MICC|nr:MULTISPECIES: DUF3662 and FHA domain-containing protein [Sinomonas]MBL0706984.1 DUF3662 and FHA domain-containing protein [Sinomonas cellulolyticus]GHG59560.1 phosphopeptide-binding protein [Sinomonas sp. KCTC 49339]
MGLLDRLERGLEKAVHGVFTTGTKGQVQPVEIASRLRREMDRQAFALDQDRTLAPNVFEAHLSDADFERARGWGQPLAEELCDVAVKHARSQGYTLQGPVRFTFRHDASLKAGEFEVVSSTEKGASRPHVPAAPSRQPTSLVPVLEIDGQRYSLNADSVVLGRSGEADIVVDDTGVSRRHLEIRREGGATYAVDLGSTNGSYIGGHRIEGSAELHDGTTIRMGRTTIVFRMLPAPRGGNA